MKVLKYSLKTNGVEIKCNEAHYFGKLSKGFIKILFISENMAFGVQGSIVPF